MARAIERAPLRAHGNASSLHDPLQQLATRPPCRRKDDELAAEAQCETRGEDGDPVVRGFARVCACGHADMRACGHTGMRGCGDAEA